MFRAFSYFFSFKIPNFFNKSFNVDSYNGLNKLKRRITISQVLFRFSIADRHLKSFVKLNLKKKICEKISQFGQKCLWKSEIGADTSRESADLSKKSLDPSLKLKKCPSSTPSAGETELGLMLSKSLWFYLTYLSKKPTQISEIQCCIISIQCRITVATLFFESKF